MKQTIKRVFDQYEATTGSWDYADLERDLKAQAGVDDCHAVKDVIIEAYEKGAWPKTLKQYHKSYWHSFENIVRELERVAQEV